jgi:hypothetical protein
VARRRAQWTRYQGRIDPARLVFIDETWTKTNMAPLRGWAPRGERLKAKVPHRRWKTMTFLAALRHDRVDAPWPSKTRSESTRSSKTRAQAVDRHDLQLLKHLEEGAWQS